MFGNLRQASDKKKKIVALVVSGCVTLVIFVLWFTISLPLHRDTGDVAIQKAEETKSIFGVAKDRTASLFVRMFERVGQVTASVNSTDLLNSDIEYRAE